MTTPRSTPFRAGGTEGRRAKTRFTAAAAGPAVLLTDISEWEPDVADAAYLDWSKAIVIRAAYGDAHDDRAWYGGARRDMLHQLGARFVGIYQYLVAGQDGTAQADVLHRLVGALRPGEVLIADFEEGEHATLTAWYNRMLLLYGTGVRPYLWTYSGLNFGQAQGALPVEWVAAYGQSEPSTPHTLWQFTSNFPVPGVGRADASVFHGTMDQLAALAYTGAPAPEPATGPPAGIRLHAGDSSVQVDHVDPPAGMTVDHYLVSVYTGSYPSAATAVYENRWMRAAPHLFGSLQDIASGMHMTLRAVAVDADGHESAYADVRFTMP